MYEPARAQDVADCSLGSPPADRDHAVRRGRREPSRRPSAGGAERTCGRTSRRGSNDPFVEPSSFGVPHHDSISSPSAVGLPLCPLRVIGDEVEARDVPLPARAAGNAALPVPHATSSTRHALDSTPARSTTSSPTSCDEFRAWRSSRRPTSCAAAPLNSSTSTPPRSQGTTRRSVSRPGSRAGGQPRLLDPPTGRVRAVRGPRRPRPFPPLAPVRASR